MKFSFKVVVVSAVCAAVLSTSGCIGPNSPTSPSQLVSTQSTFVRPSTTAPELISIQLIDALNRVDRKRVLELTCGVLNTQFMRQSEDEFRAAQMETLRMRGNGAVRGMTDNTLSDNGASVTARVSVRYDKHAAGMDADNTVIYLGRWEKENGNWKVCDFVAETR